MTHTKALEAYGPVDWGLTDILANRVLSDKDWADRMRDEYERPRRLLSEPTTEAVMYAVAYLTLRAQLAERDAQLADAYAALERYADKKNYDGYYASGPKLTGNMKVEDGVFVAKPWDLALSVLTTRQPNKESE